MIKYPGESNFDSSGACSIAVSVIIAARNAADWIGQQVEALAAQDYDGSWELIVVDNGSTDATASVAAEHGLALKEFRLLHEPIAGGGTARNTGARAARGGILAFCDADDVVDRRWLANLIRSVAPGTICFGQQIPFYEGQPLPDLVAQPAPSGLPRHASGLPALTGGLCAMYGVDLERAGYWPPLEFAPEDLQFTINAVRAGLRFHYEPGAMLWRRLPGRPIAIGKKFFQYGRGIARAYGRSPELSGRSVLRDEVWPGVRWAVRHLPFALLPGPRQLLWCKRFAFSLGAALEYSVHRLRRSAREGTLPDAER